jgi:hypothetical protein
MGDHWHIEAVTAQYAKGLICHSQQILADFTRPGFKSVGTSPCDGRDMPTVAPSANTRQLSRCHVIKIRRISGEQVFT